MSNPLFKGSLLATTVIAGSLFSVPAFAQEPIESSPEAAQEQVQGDSPQPAEIVVTGTRVARPELQASSPVTVVSAEDIRTSGSTNVEQFLNELPQVTPDATGTTNNGTDGGIATINLRDLGANRTLVLVNGRRMVASNNLGQVDLNNIPAALISRVDVVTGGASAIYGSDAVAGVVNFILKNNFEGAEVGGQYRITERGDAAIWSTDVTLGGNFADDRGNAVVHVSYLSRDKLLAGRRSRTATALGDTGDDLIPLGSSRIEGGTILLGGLTFPNGVVANQAKFLPDGTPVPRAGETFNFQPLNYLQTPQKRWLINGLAHYEITDGIEAYGEVFYANNRQVSQLAADANDIPEAGTLQVTVNNPLFNPALRTFLSTNFDEDGDGVAEFSAFRRRMSELGGRVNDFEHNVYRVLGGVRGDLTDNLKYDVYYSHARSNRSEILLNYSSDVRIQNALLVEPDPANPGQFRCIDSGARSQGCIPISVFGNGALTPEGAEYISPDAQVKRDTTQDIVSGSINGSLFNLGMGGDDAGFAVGAEYRKESSNNQPDQIVISGELGPGNSEEPTKGSFNVKEVFAEVVLPVTSMITLEGAARFSDYSTVGNVFTYKAGGQFEPVRGIRGRALYQRAVRAPNIYELFQGAAAGADDFDDPCTAGNSPSAAVRAFCIQQGVPASEIDNFEGDPGLQATTVFGGNPNLGEETADTITAGIVLEPGSLFRNFAATVDFYRVKLKDAISDLDAQTTGDLCFASLDINNAQCQAIDRNPANGLVQLIRAERLNLAREERSGIDWSLSYRFNLPGLRFFGPEGTRVSLQNVGNYTLKNRYQALEGGEFENCNGRFGAGCTGLGNFTSPKWRTNTALTLGNGPVSWRNQVRVIGKIKNTNQGNFVKAIDTQAYWDTTFVVRPTERYEFTFGIDNVLDKKIPLLGDNGPDANTDASLFDVFGRSFFAGVRLNFR